MIAQERLHEGIVFRLQVMAWHPFLVVCCTTTVLFFLLVAEVYFVLRGDIADVSLIVCYWSYNIHGRRIRRDVPKKSSTMWQPWIQETLSWKGHASNYRSIQVFIAESIVIAE